MFRTVFLVGGLALSGCGGGGELTQSPENVPPIELANEPATVDPQEVLTNEMTAELLQVLAMKPTLVDTVNLARTELTSNWRNADQLKYVMVGVHGDILGQTVPELPDRASFSATGTAQLVVTTQSDEYLLQNGDVTATLDMSQPNVAVDLQWADDDISYVGETPTQSRPAVFSANINTSLHGRTTCAADNLFCGGRLLLSADNANEFKDVELSPDTLSIGFLWYITTGCRNGCAGGLYQR